MGQGFIFNRRGEVIGKVSLEPDLTPDDALQTKDAEGNNLLEQILTQLKIANMHLALITDNTIEQSDID